MMGKLFCLSVFGRRSKVAKAMASGEMAQNSQGLDKTLAKKDVQKDLSLCVTEAKITVDIVISSPALIEVASPKDVEAGKGSASENLQGADRFKDSISPPCKPQVQIDSQHLNNAGPEFLKEAGIANSQLSSMSLCHQETFLDEVSLSVGEEASGSGDEGQGLLLQNSGKFGTDSFGECADESDFEASDLENSRQSCKGSSRPLRGGNMALFTAPANFDGMTEQGQFGEPYTEDGVDLFTSKTFTGMEDATRDAVFPYSPDKAILSIRCERVALDDDLLPGHASDPGVYQGEEMQSLNGSPVLHKDGSAMHSLVMVQSVFSQNPDSHSYVSKSATSGDAGENLSVETGRHCSEPTFHSTEVISVKPDSSSGPHPSSSHKPFWRSFTGRHRSLNQEALLEASDAVPLANGTHDQQLKTTASYSSDVGEGGHHFNIVRDDRNSGRNTDHGEAALAQDPSEVGAAESIFKVGLGLQSLSGNIRSADSALSRVKEWINTIQQPDTPVYDEEEVVAFTTGSHEEVGETSSALPADAMAVDRELASAAVRTLNALSTVAHIAGIGLREVPSLGVYNCLKTLNLSANCIARIPAGCLPQSLHSLDLSRNRLSQIEGFRELTRLRVLNLSYNKISRIGHGLANCTLIKEFYLAGNKIAEVEGLHRLLKLGVLDLSYNKLATSKALGQLAANYSSLLALNLLGNPILMNVGEDQMRKLVTSLTPHVTYLNKQPIKAVSVREAVIDSVARAALGTPQRNNKSSSSRALKRVAGVQSSASVQKKLPSHRSKDVEKKLGSSFDHSRSGRVPRQHLQSHQHHHHHNHHHHHHHHNHRLSDAGDGQHSDKGLGKEHGHSTRTPVHEHLLRNLALDTRNQAMHRSMSDSALQEE